MKNIITGTVLIISLLLAIGCENSSGPGDFLDPNGGKLSEHPGDSCI